MKNNPILIFTGLAAAAVVAVAGVTKERWMPANPETVVGEAVSTGEPVEVQKPAVDEQVPEQKLAATEQATGAEATTAVETDPVAAPSFDTVRVEKTGEALIAGRAQPGSEVTVMLDGKAIGKTTANADGAFVLTPDAPLPTGTGALTVESKTSDQAAVQSKASVAVVVPGGETKEAVVAVVSPDEPTKVLQKPEPAAAEESTASKTAATAEQSAATTEVAAAPLSLDAVDYDESGNIVFSGSGRPGGAVRVYVDNDVAGDAKAGDDGRWTFAGSSPIAAGKHTLRVDGVDAAGTVLSRVEIPFFREEPGKVASAAPEQTEVAAATTTQSSTADSATADSAATETAATGTSQTETAATGTSQTETAATETQAVEPITETAATETTQAETTTAETSAVVAATESATGATASDDSSTEQTVASTTATAATEIAKPKDGRIVIQPGNNLWRISRVIYGSGTKYTVIFESNKDQIRNPNLIFPGQVFMTPDVVPPEKIDPTRRDLLKPEEGGTSG